MLSPACGRTGTATRPHADAGQDLSRDRGPEQEDSVQEREDSAQERSEDTCCAGDLGAALDARWNCGLTMAGTRQVPVVEIVVDTSASMGELVPETGASRWELSRDALRQVISALTAASPAVGLTFLPDPDACSPSPASVPAAPITDQTRARLLAALDRVAAPAGTRSTVAALAAARADATGKAYPNGLVLGPAVLVLLTAGAPEPSPQCSQSGEPALELENQVRAARAAGAATCVFALPGAGAARDELVTVAKLGAGVSESLDAAPSAYCFQDCDRAASSAALLRSGLNCLLELGTPSGGECLFLVPRPSGSCFIPLNLPAEIDPTTAHVSLTTGASAPRTVPRVDCSSAQADGWDFAPGSSTTAMTFCGQSCADFASAWSYTISFGCS